MYVICHKLLQQKRDAANMAKCVQLLNLRHGHIGVLNVLTAFPELYSRLRLVVRGKSDRERPQLPNVKAL